MSTSTLAADALPSAVSAAICCKFTKAIFEPAGNGTGSGIGAGAVRAGGCAGLAGAGAWPNAGATPSTSTSDTAMAKPLIARIPFLVSWPRSRRGPGEKRIISPPRSPCLGGPSERRAHSEPELERFLGLQLVVEHARALRIVGEDQPERDVQHRHEEPNLQASRGLEVSPREVLSREERRLPRQAQRDEGGWRLQFRSRLHLPGIVKDHEAYWAGDGDELLDVEQQALVAAKDQPGVWILGADRSDVEAAHAVLTALEELRENRQLLRPRERVDVLVLRAEAEREAAGLFQVPHALDRRGVVIGVAAEAREIDRRRVPAAGRRKNRVGHRGVGDARRHLAGVPLTALPDEQRIS